MERKKFRSDISNSYVQALMERKRRKLDRQKQGLTDSTTDESEPAINTVTSIPADMLPKRKMRQDCQERQEYDKPEHWVKPKEEPKVPKADRFKAEKDNITKMIGIQQSWSRAARCLVSATSRPKYQARDGKIGPIRKSVPID